MKPSAFVICCDEAATIGACVAGLAALCDEVLAIDSGSRDATRAIATQQGARVLERAWPGFAEQKNYALGQCSSDWVLTLDADEELSPALLAELQALLPQLEARRHAEGIGGWAMPRRVRYEGRWIKHGDWNPDYVTRLFYRPGARYGGGQVHERIEHSGSTGKLNGLLYHYTYRDRADHLARVRQYAALWAAGQAQRGRRCGPLAPWARAAWRFARALVFKGGWRDGRLGWRIAAFSAYEVWLKYTLLRV